MKKGQGAGEPEMKVIDFLVSGSENIELLFRSLPSLVDRGIYINEKGRVPRKCTVGCLCLRKKGEKIRMGYFSVGVVKSIIESQD